VLKELGYSRATGYKRMARWRLARCRLARWRLARWRLARWRLARWRLAPLLGLSASTVPAVLTRRGLHRLAWLDRPGAQELGIVDRIWGLRT
jgi:hypothetical protein